MPGCAAPPAYSEQGYGRKISAAVHESRRQENEGDDATSESASSQSGRSRRGSTSASSSASSSSSRRALPAAPIRPLSIHKKNKSASPATPEKPRPSWYANAAAGPSSFVVHNASDAEHDYASPPPPFTALGPSLDGPPFQDSDSASARTPQPAIRPPSVASTARSVSRTPQPANPTMNFNPSMAYVQSRRHSTQPVDAAAFYNSSVAAHFTASPQRPQSYMPSPHRPASMTAQSSPYKREIPAPVPTYPGAAMRPRMPSAADISTYAPSSYANTNHQSNSGRWATSEQQLSNVFR